MIKEEKNRSVIPFFKIQEKDFSFKMNELTPVEKAS